jgi:alpha/beta hydrolase fold
MVKKKDDEITSKLQTKRIPFEQLLERLEERRRLSSYGEDRPGLTNARQPEQPPSGPGGSNYNHRSIKSGLYGKDNLAYWMFEPANPSPESVPLVVFLHGGGGGSPSRFSAWFDHLVKKGNIVVYPVYQGSMNPWQKPWDWTPPTKILTNVITAVTDAIKRLRSQHHVRADLDRCAIVGTSLGGTLAAQLASVAAKNGLPYPKAIMPIVPAHGLWGRPLPAVDLSTIPSSTMMLVVVCADDKNAGDLEGHEIFCRTPQIPAKNKNFVVMVSDYHGTPPLVANHNSPGASNLTASMRERDLKPANAMHYYGYWRLLDALTDAAFYQKNREYALGNTPEQRFMGMWSDGVPIKQLKVITDPRMFPPLRFQKRRLWPYRGQRTWRSE